MVTTLTGTVDGTAVRFERSGDTWTAEIPAKPSGLAVLELHAWDEAGNEAVWDEVLCLIDYDALTISILPDPWQTTAEDANVLFRTIAPAYIPREYIEDKNEHAEPAAFAVKELV